MSAKDFLFLYYVQPSKPSLVTFRFKKALFVAYWGVYTKKGSPPKLTALKPYYSQRNFLAGKEKMKTQWKGT